MGNERWFFIYAMGLCPVWLGVDSLRNGEWQGWIPLAAGVIWIAMFHLFDLWDRPKRHKCEYTYYGDARNYFGMYCNRHAKAQINGKWFCPSHWETMRKYEEAQEQP